MIYLQTLSKARTSQNKNQKLMKQRSKKKHKESVKKKSWFFEKVKTLSQPHQKKQGKDNSNEMGKGGMTINTNEIQTIIRE
jgi:hypothetical protein